MTRLRHPGNYAALAKRERAKAGYKEHAPTSQSTSRFRFIDPSKELGPCVYFIRCDDGLIKIGFTTQIHIRRACYGSGWERVLAVMPGSLAHEKACHALHAAHLAKGREYFHPAPDLLAHINEIREHLNIPPLDFTTVESAA